MLYSAQLPNNGAHARMGERDSTTLYERGGKTIGSKVYRMTTGLELRGEHILVSVGSRKMFLAVGVIIELFLIFATTELIFVALESDQVDNAICDFRHEVHHDDPHLYFTCSNRPYLDEFVEVLEAQKDVSEELVRRLTKEYAEIDSVHCVEYKDPSFMYFFCILLLSVILVLWINKVWMGEVHHAVDAMEKGGMLWSNVTLPFIAQMRKTCMLIVIGGMCVMASQVLNSLHNPDAAHPGTQCMWPDKVLFANLIFKIINAAFTGIATCMLGYTIYLYRTHQRQMEQLLVALDLHDDFKRHERPCRVLCGSRLWKDVDFFWKAVSKLPAESRVFDPLRWTIVFQVEGAGTFGRPMISVSPRAGTGMSRTSQAPDSVSPSMRLKTKSSMKKVSPNSGTGNDSGKGELDPKGEGGSLLGKLSEPPPESGLV